MATRSIRADMEILSRFVDCGVCMCVGVFVSAWGVCWLVFIPRCYVNVCSYMLVVWRWRSWHLDLRRAAVHACRQSNILNQWLRLARLATVVVAAVVGLRGQVACDLRSPLVER